MGWEIARAFVSLSACRLPVRVWVMTALLLLGFRSGHDNLALAFVPALGVDMASSLPQWGNASPIRVG